MVAAPDVSNVGAVASYVPCALLQTQCRKTNNCSVINGKLTGNSKLDNLKWYERVKNNSGIVYKLFISLSM